MSLLPVYLCGFTRCLSWRMTDLYMATSQKTLCTTCLRFDCAKLWKNRERLLPPVGVLACVTVWKNSAVKTRVFCRCFASLLKSLPTVNGTYGVVFRWPKAFRIEQQNNVRWVYQNQEITGTPSGEIWTLWGSKNTEMAFILPTRQLTDKMQS